MIIYKINFDENRSFYFLKEKEKFLIQYMEFLEKVSKSELIVSYIMNLYIVKII